MTVRELILQYTAAFGRAPSVSLVGFGVTNRAVYDRLRELGITPTVRQRTAIALPHGVHGIFGEDYLTGICEDILFLSPSVRRDRPPLIEAASRGVILTSECEAFFADGIDEIIDISASTVDIGASVKYPPPYLANGSKTVTLPLPCGGKKCENVTLSPPCGDEKRENATRPLPSGDEKRENVTRPPTYTVTGSDGKSTVTSMAAAMLGLSAVGNIGLPYSENEGARGYVCELSSFNLQYLTPRADACVITGITPNHLDWHRSMDEYIAAKARITERAAQVILNADDGVCLSLVRGGETLFSTRMCADRLYALGAAHAIYIADGVILREGEPVLPLGELSLGQEYNIRNFMAATGLAYGAVGIERIREVGRSFRPLSHRCEPVHTSASGIAFLDSSIDTTPMRTAATLSGLSRSVLLLLGGRGKGLSLEPLLPAVSEFATAVAIYGEVGASIYSALDAGGLVARIPVSLHERFDSALDALISLAKAGDTVLLSPAATAYGEFRSFDERGKHFADRVRKVCP